MKKEYMDQMLTWSKSVCSLDKAFHYLRFKMAGLGPPPAEGTLDKHTITKHLECLTFSTVAFTLWTRSISFLVSAIRCQSNIWYLTLRNFELVKLKCGDMSTDDINTVNGVFLKYLQGEEAALTTSDLNVYFEIHLRNWKGWQRKSDKGPKEVDLRSASESASLASTMSLY